MERETGCPVGRKSQRWSGEQGLASTRATGASLSNSTSKGEQVICPYCNNAAELVTGDVIYPCRPDLYDRQFCLCRPCDARVGCHPGTTKPLGRLANAELRRAKMAAHAAFDPLWQTGGLRRRDAYGWLAKQLGIERHRCHIGYMDMAECERVIEICQTEQAG